MIGIRILVVFQPLNANTQSYIHNSGRMMTYVKK
jgi:hypothetical protein